MIWESGPWKDALLRDAKVLERWAASTKATERRSILIERKVFLAAYAIRKLYEAEKLSTAFRDRSLRCITHPAVSDLITRSNSHKLDELYDFRRDELKTIAARDLLDLIIHSFVFSEALRDDLSVEGFLVTSDRQRYDRLWFVEMPAFLDLIRGVGRDYPSTRLAVFNDDKNDWVVWQGHGEPPAEVTRRADEIGRKRLDKAKSGRHGRSIE